MNSGGIVTYFSFIFLIRMRDFDFRELIFRDLLKCGGARKIPVTFRISRMTVCKRDDQTDATRFDQNPDEVSGRTPVAASTMTMHSGAAGTGCTG